MTTFWILWAFNALVALVPIYFFFVGLGDGTVSSRNIHYWLIIMLIVAAVIGGTLYLKSVNQLPAAKVILILAAIPGLLALAYFAIILIGKPRWN